MRTFENSINENEGQFNFELDLGSDFDVNTAFHNAITGVKSDESVALDEKIRRMEVIINEGTSEIYREFVDLTSLVAQIEMFCNHDHNFSLSIRENVRLSSFLEENRSTKCSSTEKDLTNHKNKYKKYKKKKKDLNWKFLLGIE